MQLVLITARPSVEMSPHKSALDILSQGNNNSVSSSLINTYVIAVQHFTQFPSDTETKTQHEDFCDCAKYMNI